MKKSIAICIAVLVILSTGVCFGGQKSQARGDNIDKGFSLFDPTFNKSGIMGVIEASKACHERSVNMRDLDLLEQCAAFDLFASSVDDETMRSLNAPGARQEYLLKENAVLRIRHDLAQLGYPEPEIDSTVKSWFREIQNRIDRSGAAEGKQSKPAPKREPAPAAKSGAARILRGSSPWGDVIFVIEDGISRHFSVMEVTVKYSPGVMVSYGFNIQFDASDKTKDRKGCLTVEFYRDYLNGKSERLMAAYTDTYGSLMWVGDSLAADGAPQPWSKAVIKWSAACKKPANSPKMTIMGM